MRQEVSVDETLVLRVTEGPQRGSVFPLRGKEVRIGRGLDCEVVLADPEASRLHARLVHGKEGWTLEDSGSSNGTCLNGIPARQRPVQAGDRIGIGTTEILLCVGEESLAAVEAPTAVAQRSPAARARPAPSVPEERFSGMLGRSEAMREVFAILEKTFASRAPVLISGESGTGKELVAQALHRNGLSRGGPWVVVHCAALPRETLESELFGHEAGAFTGAKGRRVGRFEWADGGTVFLDEVGEVPAEAQAKLLRVLESGEFQRLGGNEALHSSFRLVAATNRDLEASVARGKFREDLLYRIRVVQVKLPPLRERTGDVRLLAESFLTRFCQERGMAPKRLMEEAAEVLDRYPWPGNVRELKNRIETLTLFHEGEEIGPEDLRDLAGVAPAVSSGLLPARKEAVERKEIERVLEETRWNKKRAAEILGIDRKTLYARIAQWGLKPRDA